jgi:hypothetical protein
MRGEIFGQRNVLESADVELLLWQTATVLLARFEPPIRVGNPFYNGSVVSNRGLSRVSRLGTGACKAPFRRVWPNQRVS